MVEHVRDGDALLEILRRFGEKQIANAVLHGLAEFIPAQSVLLRAAKTREVALTPEVISKAGDYRL